jgi:hypothetical protein
MLLMLPSCDGVPCCGALLSSALLSTSLVPCATPCSLVPSSLPCSLLITSSPSSVSLAACPCAVVPPVSSFSPFVPPCPSGLPGTSLALALAGGTLPHVVARGRGYDADSITCCRARPHVPRPPCGGRAARRVCVSTRRADTRIFAGVNLRACACGRHNRRGLHRSVHGTSPG